MFSFLLKGKKKKKKKEEEEKKRGKCEVWGFVSYLQSSVHHGFVRDLNMFLLLKKIAADRTERFTFVCARCPKGLKRKTKPEPGQSIFTLSLSLSLSSLPPPLRLHSTTELLFFFLHFFFLSLSLFFFFLLEDKSKRLFRPPPQAGTRGGGDVSPALMCEIYTNACRHVRPVLRTDTRTAPPTG